MLLLVAPAAHAGHWQFDASGSSGRTTTTVERTSQSQPPWTGPTGPSTTDNSLSLSLPGSSATDTNYAINPSCSCTADATLTVKATWVPDPSLPSDPAPPAVWLQETSSASWASGDGFGVVTSPPTGPPVTADIARHRLRAMDAPSPICTFSGSAKDGLPDPYVPSPATGAPGSGRSDNSTGVTNPASVPPVEWTKFPANGGTVQFTRTLHADGSATNLTAGKCSVSCALGAYTVSVHATPYDFKRDTIPGSNPPVTVAKTPGVLGFQYTWKSTTGDISNLSTCHVREYVTYDSSKNVTVGGVVYYEPDDPPFPWQIPNPTKNVVVPGTDGTMNDHQSPKVDPNTGRFAFSKPYRSASFDGTQNYQYHDDSTMGTDVWEQLPGLSGPFTIHRNFTQADLNSPFYYTVSKDGEISDNLYQFQF